MPPRKRATKPSPKPEARRRGGNPAFSPADTDRKNVEFLAAIGTREDQIARLVWNPKTGQPIDAKTLRKHFRRELDAGHTKADAAVAQGLYKNATTPTVTYPGGIPVAQIFWLKVRALWRQADKPPPAPPPGHEAGTDPESDRPITAEEQRAFGQRLAFLLEAASRGK